MSIIINGREYFEPRDEYMEELKRRCENEIFAAHEQARKINAPYFIQLGVCAYTKEFLASAKWLKFVPLILTEKSSGVRVSLLNSDCKREEVLCYDSLKGHIDKNLARVYDVYINYLLNRGLTKKDIQSGMLKTYSYEKPELDSVGKLYFDKNYVLSKSLKEYGLAEPPGYIEKYRKIKTKNVRYIKKTSNNHLSYKNTDIDDLINKAKPGKPLIINFDPCPYIRLFHKGLQALEVEKYVHDYKIMAIYEDEKVSLSKSEAEKLYREIANNQYKTFEQIESILPKDSSYSKAKENIVSNYYYLLTIGACTDEGMRVTAPNNYHLDMYFIDKHVSEDISDKEISDRPLYKSLDEKGRIIGTFVPCMVIELKKDGEYIKTVFEENISKNLTIIPSADELFMVSHDMIKYGFGSPESKYREEPIDVLEPLTEEYIKPEEPLVRKKSEITYER